MDIEYDGPPGTVIGHLVSVDQSGDYSFEVPIKDPSGMQEGMQGIYPWDLQNGNKTIVHLKNTTNKSVNGFLSFTFTVNGINQMYYPDVLVLLPYQTVAIDIHKLQDSQRKDVRGHTFPQAAVKGQVEWFQETPYSIIGRAEETNSVAGIASSFSCSQDCCAYYRERQTLSPLGLNGNVDGSDGISESWSKTDCYGKSSGPYTNRIISWSTNMPSITSVASTGPNTAKVT